MKKRPRMVLIVFTLFFSAATAFAASSDLIEGMAAKARRGFIDVCTGWIELPAQIVKGFREGFKGDPDRKILGVVCGVSDGVGHSMGRTMSGVRDLGGFWAANYTDSEKTGIPLDSPYAWEKGEPYDLFDPGFTDATIVPMGEKFARGLANTLFGIMELPGQMMKGTPEGALDLGITKGFWYWMSREWCGITDIATAFLPGHTEEEGMAFDEEWPWDAFKGSLR